MFPTSFALLICVSTTLSANQSTTPRFFNISDNDLTRDSLATETGDSGELRTPFKTSFIKLKREANEAATRWNPSAESLNSLTKEVKNIISSSLSQCSLVIFFDRYFQNSEIVAQLSKSSQTKQSKTILKSWNPSNKEMFWKLLDVSWPDVFEGAIWHLNSCVAVIYLATDISPLLNYCNDTDYRQKWNYKAKFVIVSETKGYLQEVFECGKFLTTENILGLTLSSEEPTKWVMYINQFFRESPMKLLTTSDKESLFEEDKLRDFNNAELKIVTFEWKPSVMYQRDKNGNVTYMYGMDATITNTLSEALNFRIKLLAPPPNEYWGVPLANGGHTGLVGMVSRGEADIGMADVFITNERKHLVDYSFPHDVDLTCFLGVPPSPVPSWQSLLFPFQPESWLSFAIILLLTSMVLYVFAKINWSMNRRDISLGSTPLMITLRAHFKEPTITDVRHGNSSRIFLGFLWIYCTVLVIAYSSNLTAFLTIQKQTKPIDTIKELRQSELKVVALGPFFKGALISSTDEDLQVLAERFVSHDNLEDIFSSVLGGKGMMLQNILFLQYAVKIRLFKAQKDPMKTLRIMKECFSPYSVGLYFPKNSLYKRKFDEVIARMTAAGLVKKGFLDALELSRQTVNSEFGEIIDDESIGEGGPVILTLDHLQGIFGIYVLGSVVAFFVFLTELFLIKKNSK